jgi:hypothetical protein
LRAASGRGTIIVVGRSTWSLDMPKSIAVAITEHLIEEGIAARAHFQTWWALRNLAIPTYLPTMNDMAYVDFFHASNSAHYKLYFIAISKIYDRDPRVAGISELRKALKAEGRDDLARYIQQQLKPLTGLLKKVLAIRNKVIAHNEFSLPRTKVYQIHGVTPNQIRDLIDQTCEVINHVAREIGFSNTIFDSDRHQRATISMLERLKRGHV